MVSAPAVNEFPTDDTTLDLLWTAIHPGPEAQRSSLGDLLTCSATSTNMR